MREVNKARLPYNLNFFSQAAAMAALEAYEAQLLRQRGTSGAVREELASSLSQLSGVRAYPSRANFILVELLEADPKAVFEALVSGGSAGARRDLLSDVGAVPAGERGL